jgi:hypothetical protein
MFPSLYSPGRIGAHTIPNRVVFTAMGNHLAVSAATVLLLGVPPAAGASVVTALGGVVLDGRQPDWARSGIASPAHKPARIGGGLFPARVQSESSPQDAHLTYPHGFPEVREGRRGQPVGRSTRSRTGKSDSVSNPFERLGSNGTAR